MTVRVEAFCQKAVDHHEGNIWKTRDLLDNPVLSGGLPSGLMTPLSIRSEHSPASQHMSLSLAAPGTVASPIQSSTPVRYSCHTQCQPQQPSNLLEKACANTEKHMQRLNKHCLQLGIPKLLFILIILHVYIAVGHKEPAGGAA